METKGYEIEGWKDHRGSYDIINEIRKKMIEFELSKNIQGLIDIMRIIIGESAPYNPNWLIDLKNFEKEVEKIYSPDFLNEDGTLKLGKPNKEKYAKVKTEFLEKYRILKGELLIKFSNALIIPRAEKVFAKYSEEEDNPDEKEKLQALESAGLI